MVTKYTKWQKILMREFEKTFNRAPHPIISHDIVHPLRMWKQAKYFCKKLGADPQILFPAILYHDLGVLYTDDVKHGEISAKIAKQILKGVKYPKQKIPYILEAIKLHDNPSAKRKNIESQIVFDLDVIEAFGAAGVYRYLDAFIKRGWDIRKIASHVVKNVSKRFNSLHNKEIKELYRHDYEYTKQFFEKLNKELNSDDL